MKKTEQRKIDTLAIFEDLYRVNMRQSLFELEMVLAQIETLPRPYGQNERMVQETLRGFASEAITSCEQKLGELRARFEALPKLPAKKGEVDDAS